MEHWLSLSAGISLLAMILYGHYRGLLRMSVNLLALILSIGIVRMATPWITTYIRENTQLHHTIENALTDAVGLSGDSDETWQPSYQRTVIEQLKLPKQMEEILLENNNSEIYRLLGVDTFLEYVGMYLANMILNTIGGAILFVAVNLTIRVLIRWMDLIARLPILSGINQIAGALLGGIQGLTVLWAGCVLADLCSQTEWAIAVLEQIQQSAWLSFLYHNNLINWIFINLLRSIG